MLRSGKEVQVVEAYILWGRAACHGVGEEKGAELEGPGGPVGVFRTLRKSVGAVYNQMYCK